MILNFPKIPGAVNATYLSTVLDTIREGFRQVNSRRYAQDRVLLRSPNGTVYQLTIDNSGVVGTVIQDGKSFD